MGEWMIRHDETGRLTDMRTDRQTDRQTGSLKRYQNAIGVRGSVSSFPLIQGKVENHEKGVRWSCTFV